MQPPRVHHGSSLITLMLEEVLTCKCEPFTVCVHSNNHHNTRDLPSTEFLSVEPVSVKQTNPAE